MSRSPRILGLLAALFLLSAPAHAASREPKPLAPASTRAPHTDRHGIPLPPGARTRLGLPRFKAGDQPAALAYSPDGRTLAVGDKEGVVRLWQVPSGGGVQRFTEERVMMGVPQAQEIQALAWSPDGRVLAVGLSEAVCLWDCARPQRIRRLRVPADVYDLAFSPDGKLVAAASKPSVYVWETATGRERTRLDGHESEVQAVAFTADGKVLVSAGADGTARFWDGKSGLPLRQQRDGQLWGDCAAFAPAADRMVSWADRGTIHLWKMSTGEALGPIGTGDDAFTCLALSPDGRTLAARTRAWNVELWNVATRKSAGHVILPTTFIADRMVFSPDGKTLALTGKDGLIHFWDVAERRRLPALASADDAITALTFLPDGSTLVAGSAQGKVRLWKTNTARLDRLLLGHEIKISSLAASADGKRLATADADGKVCLWNPATGKRLRRFEAHDTGETLVAFRPAGKRLISGGADGLLRAWNPRTGKPVGQWPRLESIGSLAISPDGRSLAMTAPLPASGFGALGALGVVGGFGGPDLNGPVMLWDLAERRERRHFGTEQACVAFLPTGEQVVTVGSDRAVWLWNASTGKALRPVAFHSRPVSALAVSPDGRLVATVSGGDTAAVWELASGSERSRFRGHLEAITALCFSADGKTLATGSEDGSILLWNVGLDPMDGRPSARLRPAQLTGCWKELASPDAGSALGAMRVLASDPERSIPFLAKHLAPDCLAPGQLERWLAELDSERYAIRQLAALHLERCAELATPRLRKLLAEGSSLDVRRRVESILARMDAHPFCPERLRVLRAIEVLEADGDAKARGALATLAGGDRRSVLTRAAKAALERMNRQARIRAR